MSCEIKMKHFYIFIAGLIIALLPLCFLAYQIFTIDRREEIAMHEEIYPLDGSSVYLLHPNRAIESQNYPANVFYLLTPVEQESSASAGDFIAGRKIGKSLVDLSAYLNRRVRLIGSHYWGTPLLLSEIADLDYLQPQSVILIKEIYLD